MSREDYTKFAKKQEDIFTEETIVENEELVIDCSEESYIGIVSNCKKLNIRNLPNIKSDIVCVIDEFSEVMIDKGESTNEFYKVYTVSGLEGYCFKKYIMISQ